MSRFSITPNATVSFRIRYEDDDLLVVDKPARLVTQPGKGHEDDTLLNGLFARFGAALQNLGKARDFGLLHRLDRQTPASSSVDRQAPAWQNADPSYGVPHV